jgi:hypothetical protein
MDALASACGAVGHGQTAAVLVDPLQLQQAVLQRSIELGQYLSAAYIGMLAAHEVRSSVGRTGTCWDSKNDSRWQGLGDLTRAGTDHGVLALTCRSAVGLPLSSISRAVT